MRELTATDIYHFREGTFFRAYDKLGAHPDSVGGIQGTRFAVCHWHSCGIHPKPLSNTTDTFGSG